MDLGIEGRVALVMGASKGIGRGIASALAAEGARLAVSSRSEENLAALVADLGSEQAAAYPPTPATSSASASCRVRSSAISGRSRSSY